LARIYCEKHNLQLHDVSYRDLGVSAFKRKNIEKGALATFIAAVKSGIVPKGSYLIFEQFDRLSRTDIDVALTLLLDLVRSGITVVTLADNQVWDRKAIKDIGKLTVAIAYMSRANSESEAKSDRLEEVWDQKKLKLRTPGGRILTSECPRWLSVNSDKMGFSIIEDRAESIRKVFELRIGGYGISSIMTRANSEGWEVPGNGNTWHTSLIARLLLNRSLVGEYQPFKNDKNDDGKRAADGEPILNYYPVVIDETTFLRAQAKSERSGPFPGRRDASLKNWLQGLIHCPCGARFVRKNKDSKAQPGYSRYYCTSRNRGLLTGPGGTKCEGVNALELENAVLAVVSGVTPQFFAGSPRTENLKQKADLLELELSTAQSSSARFIEAIAISTAAIPGLVTRLNASEADIERFKSELKIIRTELADLDGDYDAVFENIAKAVRSVNSLDARAALREDLSRIIKDIVVHQPEGYIEVYLRGSDAPVVQLLRANGQLPGLHMESVNADVYALMLKSK
jgi:DNA invertase Pin-like site-specific DNA recombinase